MGRTVAHKMGIIENSRAIFVNPDPQALDSIEMPVLDISQELDGEFDHIHLFVKRQTQFRKHFPNLKSHLKPEGKLWVSWPKAGKLGIALG